MDIFKQALIWAGVGSGHAVLLVVAWGSGSEPRASREGWIQLSLLAPAESIPMASSTPVSPLLSVSPSLMGTSLPVIPPAQAGAPSLAQPVIISAETSEGSETVPPQFHFRAEPTYPRAARLAGVEGKVCLRLEISRKGLLHRATVVLSSGNQELDAAALEAAQNSTYHPARSAAGPLEASAEASYRFVLRTQ